MTDPFDTPSHWHKEFLSFGQILLIAIKSQEILQPKVFCARDMYNIHGAMPTFHGVRGGKRFCNFMNILSSCLKIRFRVYCLLMLAKPVRRGL